MVEYNKIYSLGSLKGLKSSWFRHSQLPKEDQRFLKRHSVWTCAIPDDAAPLIEQMIRLVRTEFSQLHSSTSNDMGMIAGPGSVRPHHDAAHWTLLAPVWIGRGCTNASLMVEEDHVTLEVGEVVLFRSNKTHCWVCERPWSALFVDWDDWGLEN